MNKNILVSEVPGGGGVHGGHIQPTDYLLYLYLDMTGTAYW